MSEKDITPLNIWLALACGPGSAIPDKLVAALGSVNEVYAAGENELCQALPDISRPRLSALLNKSTAVSENIQAWCMDNNVGIITPDDDIYPKRLYSIKSKPYVLYYIGNLPDIDNNVCIACVGTRRMSKYGRLTAYSITHDLVRAGSVIISGLAEGIDTVCHRSCIDAGGHTVAVLGCGIDRVYPQKNRALMREIARFGTLVTEYPPHTPPSARNFPIRNRIICGLCHGTVVFEADHNSGSLITAKYALAEGRNLFALPGNAGELNSLGTNDLIKQGAKLVTSAYDIIDEYEFLYPQRLHGDNLQTNIKIKKKQSPARRSKISTQKTTQADLSSPSPKNTPVAESPQDSSLSPVENQIISALSRVNGKSTDTLLSLGIPAHEVLGALTILEIKGKIEALPGGMYIKK